MPDADTGYASFDEHVADLAGGAGEDVEAGNDAEQVEGVAEVQAEQVEAAPAAPTAPAAEVPDWQRAIDALGLKFAEQMEALAARLAPSAPVADPAPAALPPKSVLHQAAREQLGEHATDEQVEQYVKVIQQQSGWAAFGEGQPEAAQAREALQAKQTLIETRAELARVQAELRAQKEELSDPDGPFGTARAEYNRRATLAKLSPERLGKQLPHLAKALQENWITIDQVVAEVPFGEDGYQQRVIDALTQTEKILKALPDAKASAPALPAAEARKPANPLTGAPSGLAGGAVNTEPEGYADFDTMIKQVRRDHAREMN